MVLADSLHRHNPGAELTVAILEDGPPQEARGALPFATLSLADLQVPDLPRRASRYTINELAMSLKALVIRAVLARGEGPVCWLDGDCAVYSSLEGFGEQVASASVTLTPHLLGPLPPGAPTEATVMFAGTYNTGIIAVDGGAESLAFLDWWEGHLAAEGLMRPEAGLFVDQRWADLVLSLFPRAAICRDRAVNAAYWNLRERRLGERDGQFTVDDRPLQIYHFSGFDPASPQCPSRYVPSDVAPDGSPLRGLLEDYALRLLSSPQSDAAPPPFGSFPGGVRIDDRGRRLLCEAIDRGELALPVYEGPSGDEAREWLLAPGACPGGLSRWVESFRAETDAVREVFPDPVRDGRRLVAWLRRTGMERYELDPLLLHGPALLAATTPQAAPAVALGPGPAPELAERLRAVLATIPTAVAVFVAAPAGAERDAAIAVAGGRELDFVDGGDAALARLVADTAPRDVAVVREGAVLPDGWLEGLWDTARRGEGVAAVVPVAADGQITSGDAEGVATIARRAGTPAADLDAPCMYLRRDALDLAGVGSGPDEDWPGALTTAFREAGLELLLADDVLVGGRASSTCTPVVRRALSVPRGFTLALAPAPAGDEDVAIERVLLAAALAERLGPWFVDLEPGAPVEARVDAVLSLDSQLLECPAHVARVVWPLGAAVGTGGASVAPDLLVRARAGEGESAGPTVLPGLGTQNGRAETAPEEVLVLGAAAGSARGRFAAAVRALGPPGGAAILLGESGRTRAWALALAGVPVLVAPDLAWRLGLGDEALRLTSWRPADVSAQISALQRMPDARAGNADAWERLLSARPWSDAADQIAERCRDSLAVVRPPRA